MCRLRCISQRETRNRPCSQILCLCLTRMKQRRARRGKPSSAKRVAAWRERANRAYAQWRVVEIEMGVLVKSSRMTAAIQLYHDRLPHLCERLKSSTERWLQSLWRRLMIQHASRVLSVIIKQWQLLIRTKHSVRYLPISFHTNCHTILWHGRIQSVHRTTQGTFMKHSRQRLHRRLSCHETKGNISKVVQMECCPRHPKLRCLYPKS